MAASLSGWPLGPARLGFGGDGETTLLANGGATTWLRHKFTVANPSAYQGLRLDLLRDDGVLVRLNGQEIVRENLPSGTISSTTLATATITGTAEQQWKTWDLPSTGLSPGPNVLTVELHQASLTSSDVGFDLRLRGLVAGEGNQTFAQWQAAMFGSDATQPTLAGPQADPDADGRVNLLEYALASRPDTPDAAPLTISATPTTWSLRFPKNPLATSANVTLTLEAAENLSGPWSPVSGTTGSTAQGQIEVVELRRSDWPRRFFRLRVQML